MVSQLEIQARIERYGLLRSALRALEASSPDAGSFGLEESFQQIRGWLRELRTSNADTLRDPSAETQVDGIEQVSSAQIAHLDNLDRKLEQLQTAIVAQIRSIRLSQLRATLPAVKRQNPEELKALFDLCLIAHDSDSPWWSLIDYMITLLACEEKGGRRYVARDPTRLTPRLDELCAACDREKNDLTDALVHMFHRARVDLERGNPAGPIIEKMRSAKHQAMETLLIWRRRSSSPSRSRSARSPPRRNPHRGRPLSCRSAGRRSIRWRCARSWRRFAGACSDKSPRVARNRRLPRRWISRGYRPTRNRRSAAPIGAPS
jgi:hypothetical protein